MPGARKLQLSGDSGQTLDVIVRLNGKPWNGSKFVDYSDADYATYVLPMTEQDTTGFYEALFPIGISPGRYHLTFSQRIDPATPSPTDTIIYQALLTWDGNYLVADGK